MAYAAAASSVLQAGGAAVKNFLSDKPYDQYISSLEDIKDMRFPELEYTPLQESVNQSYDINRASFPRLKKLARRTNDLIQDETFDLYRGLDANFDATQAAEGQNNYDLTRGIIPQDVNDAIFRNNAGKFVGIGTPGTGLQSKATARDLGLTSLDLMQRGQQGNNNSIQRWQSLASRQVDPSNFMVSPFQIIDYDRAKTLQQFQRNMSEYGAQTDIQSAIAQGELGSTSYDNEQMSQFVDSLTGAAAGGIGGLMGGIGVGKGSLVNRGGFNSPGAAKSAAPYTNIFSSNNFGYTPVAKLV